MRKREEGGVVRRRESEGDKRSIDTQTVRGERRRNSETQRE